MEWSTADEIEMQRVKFKHGCEQEFYKNMRKEKCKYCDSERRDFLIYAEPEGFNTGRDYTYLNMFKPRPNTNWFLQLKTGNAYLAYTGNTRIFYCPFCGRKLS